MQTEQIITGLKSKFKKSRIVFWYDPDEGFNEQISLINIPDVSVLDMTTQSVFETKKRIELDEPEQSFLLYFPHAEPAIDNDWMLDIRLYSEQFFADVSSIQLNELGIPRMELRHHIRERQLFFNSQQRVTSLKKLVTENEDELSLDQKMIAVSVKADSASIYDIMFSLLKNYAESIGSDEPKVNSSEVLTKFSLDASLWKLLKHDFGYDVEEPSLADFALKLFCTELWKCIDTGNRDWLSNNVLQTASGRATALAFMVSWRDSRSFAESHDTISDYIDKKIEVMNQCADLDAELLLECETFESIEKMIIRNLVNGLLDTGKVVDRNLFETILSKRLSGHWCLSRNEYTAIYESLRSAELLIHLRQRFIDGFHYDSVKSMYNAYVTELFQFDKAYRLFNENAHTLFSKGAEILRQLDDAVEDIYTNWYLYELGIAWDRLLEKEQLLDNWTIQDVPSQYKFFNEQVRNIISNKQTKRMFVVISDALRYEAAEELFELINNERRFKAEISTQLSVLPSYTQLGMAALLPHMTLSYKKEQSGVVFIDGRSSAGIDNRNSILNKVNGIAVSSKELMTWSNEEGRDKVRDAEVVYIYHDTIDAIGDKAATEEKTFEACRSAIHELKDLVTRVINRMNGSRVIVTADHGFLFQQKNLEKTDKTSLISKPTDTIEAKKRYIIGNDIPTQDICWKGKIADSAGGSCDTEFLLPKITNRFHFVGGAKFVHGGAMLQEVCVPIITVRALRKEQAAKHEKKRVGIVVASQPIKIVNNIDKVGFIQTDPVGDKYIARKLDIFINDNAGNEVSSRETLIFDSRSTVMDERIREARLKLIGSNFNRRDAYTLVLEDVETKTCYNQYAVTIDLAIQDDFF